MTEYFSSETVVVRRHETSLNDYKEKKRGGRDHQAKIPYTVKISFRNESKIKTFLDEEKLRGFIASRPSLKRMLNCSD